MATWSGLTWSAIPTVIECDLMWSAKRWGSKVIGDVIFSGSLAAATGLAMLAYESVLGAVVSWLAKPESRSFSPAPLQNSDVLRVREAAKSGTDHDEGSILGFGRPYIELSSCACDVQDVLWVYLHRICEISDSNVYTTPPVFKNK